MNGRHLVRNLTGLAGGLLLCLVALFLSFGSSSEALENIQEAPFPKSGAATEQVTRTIFLPIVFSNYEPPVPTIFGVQMYGDLTSPSAGLTHTRDARAWWVRWPMAWSAVEPTDTIPENYNFAYYDANILAAHQAGLHLIVTVQSNPSWAATYANGPIDKVDIGEFAEFMGTVAERYDGDGWEDAPGSPVVDYWEFYNEPDAGDRLRAEYGASYWGHFGTEYARMLCAVYPVIKAANPRAQVVLGGLAYDAFEDQGGGFVREFLDDVLKAGGGHCFDLMNFHYYPPFAPNWAPYGPGLSGKANYLKDKLAQYGFATKPIICTEAGWHSDNYAQFPSTPEIQSRYVVKLFAQSLASRLQLTIWWTWIDPGSYYGANGLLTQSLERKPAFYAYRTAAYWLGRASYQRALTTVELGSSAMEGYLLTWTDGKPLYVLWSNDDQARAIGLSAAQAQVINMYGDTIGLVSDGDDGQTDGHLRVNVGPNPIYVKVLQ
jgi:hypothetical protein